MYETWLESIPCGFPAVLVTGNGVGIAAETATAASESAIVVATVHSTDAAAALHPFLSFPREAVPDANVIAITGIAMHTPRFTMNEEAALSTLSADGSSPKISAVANPMRSAAIYVIHVFIEPAYSTTFRPSIIRGLRKKLVKLIFAL